MDAIYYTGPFLLSCNNAKTILVTQLYKKRLVNRNGTHFAHLDVAKHLR